MDKYRKRRAVAVAHEMVDLLAEKGYITYYAENVEEARDKVLELIPKGASVGVGGSETLKAMDMINILRNGDYHFLTVTRRVCRFPRLRKSTVRLCWRMSF